MCACVFEFGGSSRPRMSLTSVLIMGYVLL